MPVLHLYCADGQGYNNHLGWDYTMQVIQGVELLINEAHRDTRGTLVALEEQSSIPFEPRRIFYITGTDFSSVRAGHAGTSEQLIIALNGSVTVELDNGQEQSSLRLADNLEALWIRPGIWLRLREFSEGTVLLVISSLTYAETQHFMQPQPLFQAG
ncbi:MAG TPA: FdtA/QdtA family cupin domain-containing protein [Chlorobaculum sp.]|nr:FdtA/QdtA family cupin domain-containing protein [Chlorobaculum sp.]